MILFMILRYRAQPAISGPNQRRRFDQRTKIPPPIAGVAGNIGLGVAGITIMTALGVVVTVQTGHLYRVPD